MTNTWPTSASQTKPQRPASDPIIQHFSDLTHRAHRQWHHFTTPGNERSAAEDIKLPSSAVNLSVLTPSRRLAPATMPDHRLTRPNHPWTNGLDERMNRTIKEATVRHYYYESHDRLREHLATFLGAYNYAKRLKTLNGLSPFGRICPKDSG